MTTRKCKVCIDAGHGGRDPGAVGPSGVQEKVVTLAVAQKVAGILRSAGIEVLLTRDADKHLGSTTGADLSARAKIANQAGVDCFVSIHCNSASNNSAQGTETYCYKGANEARKLAEAIQKYLIGALGRPDRGVKEANFAVLRETAMPAVLAELAFISNPTEEDLLENPNFQEKAAQAIAQGIADYLGVKLAEKANDAPKICVGNKVFDGIIIDGTTYVAVRALAEALGRKVVWDSKTRTVTIE